MERWKPDKEDRTDTNFIYALVVARLDPVYDAVHYVLASHGNSFCLLGYIQLGKRATRLMPLVAIAKRSVLGLSLESRSEFLLDRIAS
eukprot:scaffold3365_cov358-Prasinococcus_capsulatus_cf.AAC.1